MKLIFIVPFLLAFHLSFQCGVPDEQDPEKDWWETAQFYQIYPRSFKDSDGDGIGDLKGITEKLDHLRDIGVSATWLSPIFKSPMKDFGYDISNFTAIQEEYGTMEDFENLVKKAKSLGIKIILDFVPNHSSDQSQWFIDSVNRVEGYENFYVWHPGKPDPNNATNRLPPSNWLQAFRGSAWEWNPTRQQFYLHQFAVQQPDLNYRNPLVVQKMKDVLTFWLDKGVDGFRIDAVPWVFEVRENAAGDYPDEPVSGYTDDPDEAAYLKHIYTQDQPETVDMVYQWRALMDEYKEKKGGDTRVLLTETYSEIDYVVQFYGNSTHRGAHVPFNFNFITRANKDSTATQLDELISLWLTKMPKGTGYVANWVLGNHDQRRVGSRYGKERIDQMNMILMMLPGVGISYNGEEIGMLDGQISWEESKDPAACNSNPDIYEKFTRDPARTPFQWDNTKNAGFSTANQTWLPVASNYPDVNVKIEKIAERSHLKVYKDLIALRQSRTLRYGNVNHNAVNNNILVVERPYESYVVEVSIILHNLMRWKWKLWERRNVISAVNKLQNRLLYCDVERVRAECKTTLNGAETFVLVVNISGTIEVVNLKSYDISLPASLICKIVNVESKRKVGDTVTTSMITLDPYESLVLSTS